MSFSTDCSALEASFRTTAELLRQLLAGLQARRAAWISARPSLLAPSPELERITQDVAHEESRRDELQARIVNDRLRAGLPTAVAPAGTGLVTTALLPTLAPSPTVKPPSTLAPAPTMTLLPSVGWRLAPLYSEVPPSVTPW